MSGWAIIAGWVIATLVLILVVWWRDCARKVHEDKDRAKRDGWVE